VGVEFELRVSHLQSRLYCLKPHPFLKMGVSETIYLGWPQNTILPISASQVVRIMGVSHP
jgi:hypothetical protein